MKLETQITNTTNYNYEVIFEKKDKNNGDLKNLNWSVSLTTTEEKKSFLLIAESAINQIKTDNFTTIIEKRHPGTNVWLKCNIPDELNRKAMLLCLEQVCKDIISDLQTTK